ncbi:MAG TPA: hypothetical protein VHM91_05920 [Verrucomicrobiales bacterium]|jgi:hypothetical protein|nr:hypothetical protein [Verrucomicrobiales bacterium]
MIVPLLAFVDEAADNASKLAANIAVGLMLAVFFVKFIQMVFFRKRKPRE